MFRILIITIILFLLTACSDSPMEVEVPIEEEISTIRYHISQPYSDGIFPDTVYVHIRSDSLPAHYNLTLCDNDEDGGCSHHSGTVNEIHNWAFVIQYFSLTPTGDFEIWNEYGDTLTFTWRASDVYQVPLQPTVSPEFSVLLDMLVVGAENLESR